MVMAEPKLSNSPSGTREIRLNAGSNGSGSGQYSPKPGIRKVSLRAEIDTSLPFESVKEAVTRFGGHGPWVNPLYKLGDTYHEEEVFDIKRVEEQTAELEKDLIVKELETLDVLEELTTTKRIVQELKRQFQKEYASKCPSTDFHHDQTNNVPTSSPSDLILMELNRAKLNLGKTIEDLGAIQSSVESLTKRMRKEKEFITSNDHYHHRRLKSDVALMETNAVNYCSDQNGSEFRLSEPDKMSFNFRVQSKTVRNVNEITIMRKMKEATEEVKLSKKALEEAFNRADLASKKQLAAEEALSKLWLNPDQSSDKKRHVVSHNTYHESPIVDRRGIDDLRPVLQTNVSMRDVLSKKQAASSDREFHYGQNETRKVALSDMLQSLRDDMSLKDHDYHIPVSDQINNHSHVTPQKQFLTQRKKFGFIHISLPLTKPSKKKIVNQSL